MKKETQFLALWKLWQFTVIIIRKNKIKLGVEVDTTMVRSQVKEAVCLKALEENYKLAARVAKFRS